VDRRVRSEVKLPWDLDLLNLNLGNDDLPKARASSNTSAPSTVTAPAAPKTSTSSLEEHRRTR